MDIQIGTQVKIINPDDTSEYGVVSGDEGVVVWVGEFGTVFGVCIPKKGDVWSFESSQLEITSNFSVPEGFALVPKEPTEAMHQAGQNTMIFGGGYDDIYVAMLEAQEPK